LGSLVCATSGEFDSKLDRHLYKRDYARYMRHILAVFRRPSNEMKTALLHGYSGLWNVQTSFFGFLLLLVLTQ